MTWPKSRTRPRKAAVRNDILGISLLSSVAIHICVILIGSVILQRSHSRRQDFLPIRLVGLPAAEAPAPRPKVEVPPVRKKLPPPPPKKVEKPKESRPIANASTKPEKPATLPPVPVKEEPPQVAETKPVVPAKAESASSFASTARLEGGGSAAGAENLFDKGDVGVIPGAGTAGSSGGAASSGLGRGSGAPGLPARSVLRSNRAAKPLQTMRANYPPMALRAGLESDVTLKSKSTPKETSPKLKSSSAAVAALTKKRLKPLNNRASSRQRKTDNLSPPNFPTSTAFDS